MKKIEVYTVARAIKLLQSVKDKQVPFMVASDEELNSIFTNWEFTQGEKGEIIVFGYSGSERQDIGSEDICYHCNRSLNEPKDEKNSCNHCI